MTHRLATNYAKNYCNRTPIVKVIVENVVTCFLGGTQCRFGHSLKTFFFQSTSAYSVLVALAVMCYTNLHFTYLHIVLMRLSCACVDQMLVVVITSSSTAV